ncbi:UBP-type zinc finger domain-containing protein [Jannaschia sp. R86511]|uniref:UBP-type zinc finger domain-containing protein n=1 Tax=Jannaschia sp. R86511 TaxID=3093853 RepID=UPI0036D34786
MSSCPHLDDTARPEPEPVTPDGCQECLAVGGRWVHLRLCTACGHVGCCDSSPRRHATAHHHGSGHPVVRSFEPGETWRWCYVHEALVGR